MAKVKNETAQIKAFIEKHANELETFKKLAEETKRAIFSNFIDKVEKYAVGKFAKVVVSRANLHQRNGNDINLDGIQDDLNKLAGLKAAFPNISLSYAGGGMNIIAERYQTEEEALAELTSDYGRVTVYAHNVLTERARAQEEAKAKMQKEAKALGLKISFD